MHTDANTSKQCSPGRPCQEVTDPHAHSEPPVCQVCAAKVGCWSSALQRSSVSGDLDRWVTGARPRRAPGGSKPPPRTPSLEICLYATVSAPVPTPLPQHLLPAPKSVHRRPAPVTLATVTVSRASAPSNPQPFGCQLLCHHSYYCFKIQFRQFRGSRDGGGFMGSGANLPSPSNRRGQDTWTAVATNEHAPTQQMS